MYSKKRLSEEIKSVQSVRSLTEVYQRISAISVVQVKNSVAKTRSFLSGVSLVYGHAKQAYITKAQNIITRRKDLSNLSFIRRNNKDVLVLVSSNQSLYGDLIMRVFREFIKDVRETKSDSVVIGKLGRAMMEREDIDTRVDYFELDDYKPDWSKLQEITDFTRKYEKIKVYYGEFLSIANQVPAKSDISGGATLESQIKVVRDYIFEPTPEKIMEFFETQVIANLFHQKVYEAQLARFASRLVTMNDATKNANEKLERFQADFLKLKKYGRNKKQLSTMSGRMLWGI